MPGVGARRYRPCSVLLVSDEHGRGQRSDLVHHSDTHRLLGEFEQETMLRCVKLSAISPTSFTPVLVSVVIVVCCAGEMKLLSLIGLLDSFSIRSPALEP